MTTKQKVWGKAILSSYNYLQRMCDSIDLLVERTALNSYFSVSSHFNDTTIDAVSRKIINLSNRKIGYINLKLIIDKALRSIPKIQAKIIILKYIHKYSIEKTSELLGISVRAGYRRLESALSAFMATLTCMGYTSEKLEIEYSSDPFISSLLRLLEKNSYIIEEKAKVISNDSVFNKYISDLLVNVV